MRLILMASAVATMLFGVCAKAQVLMSEDVEQEFVKPIPLIENESETMAKVDLEMYDPAISYYVQNLNLTPKQLDEAQRISDADQAKKEDLLRRIETLRREAYDLQAGSLIAFEAILDDVQRAAFRELRSENEKINNKMQDSAESNENYSIK